MSDHQLDGPVDPRALLAISLLLLLPGCVTEPRVASTPAAIAPVGSPGVVVAVIDSGLNPYHESLAAANHRFPAMASLVSLSTKGDYAERVAADASTWSALKPETLYGFEGTRLMGISFLDLGADLFLDSVGHGSMTSGIAARASPDATIIVVQVDGSVCMPTAEDGCLLDPSVAKGLAWAAAQPWIDVISLSLAIPGNIPDPEDVHPEVRAYLDASRAAAASGKLVITAAGNSPPPGLLSYVNGPPWVVAVGAVQAEAHGSSLRTSQLVDLTANHTEYAPAPETTDKYRYVSGTSISTPIVAGTVAQALFELRAENRDVRPADLRPALNATARYFRATDWNPTASPTKDPVFDLLLVSAPVVAGSLQMGWGYIEPVMAAQLKGAYINGSPPRDEFTELSQSQWQAARERVWG